MERIRAGVQHFRDHVFPTHRPLFEQLSHGQSPAVLFVTCADSRVDPTLITSSQPGTLFVLRNAGNLIPTSDHPPGGEAATVDYAVRVLQVRHIVVCGHSSCGAMSHLMSARDGRSPVDHWLRHAHPVRERTRTTFPDQTGDDLIRAAIFVNALAQLDNLRTWPEVARAEAVGALQLHAWMYEIPTGQILAYDQNRDGFVPLAEASGEAPLVDDLATWTLVLHDAGPRAPEVIASIVDITSWPPSEVTPLLSSLPLVLLQGLSHMEAEVAQSWLRKAGASIALKRESG